MRLTDPLETHSGRLVATVDGHEAYCDAIAALRLLELAEEDAAPQDKSWVAWRVVFVDGDKASADDPALLSRAAWELYGIDLDGSHESECGGKRVIDWKADAQRIAASVMQVYGMPWHRFARENTFRDVCAMIGMLPRETPMGTAIYYRTAEAPKFNGRNAEQVQAFRKLQQAYAIEGKNGMADANASATDMFNALRRAAQNG